MSSLPIELERVIFESAILQYTNHAHKVNIMLVAKRVYEWTRPLLYRVVIADFISRVCGDEFVVIRNPNTRMADIAPFTRDLFCLMYGDRETNTLLIELLSTFRNIENLAIFPYTPITPDILKSMDGLPLRRISFCLPGDLSDAVKHCPTLKNVTHFELLLLELTWNDFIVTLVEFPNLTHLCLDLLEVLGDEIFELLECCNSLRVLVYSLDTVVESIQFNRLRASDEARFLVIKNQISRQDYIAEWGRSANGQIGFWELADIIVEARQRKLFKAKSPLILSRRDWMNNLNDDGIRWYEEWSEGRKMR